ncbi:MAG: bifunctional riboflavin kinase/FAD synthetase [Flavobacteriaceae bacterium]
MKVVHQLENYFSERKTVFTVGTYDGLHIGHQKILKKLVATAREKNLETVVLTFFPHPRQILQKDVDLKLIDTIDEKIDALAAIGIDTLIIHPFSVAFSRLSALEFTRNILVEQLNVAEIFMGYDHRFGRNRESNIDDLKALGETYRFRVHEIPAQDIQQIAVSSTKIRKAVSVGNWERVEQFLGRPFQLKGMVVKGQQLGRQLNFPTANLHIPETYKMIPPRGVYWVRTTWDQESCYGMMNIGTRPTLKSNQQTIEIHLFDFDGNLYGKKLRVEILRNIREEKAFASLEALQEQLEKDASSCRKWMKQTHS